jgi:hypothetical protein
MSAKCDFRAIRLKVNLAHPAGLAYRLRGNPLEVAAMTPSEALQHIVTLVEASADLKDDTQRKLPYVALLWSLRRVLVSRRMVWPNASLTS